jgi:hypothetical protein
MQTTVNNPIRTHVPKKSNLIVGIVGGSSLIALGIALLVVIAVVEQNRPYDYGYSYYGTQWHGSGIAWYMWLTPIIIGIALIIWFTDKFIEFYREVNKGKVTDTGIYTNRWGDVVGYSVTIRGKTLAGEVRTSVHTINKLAYDEAFRGQVLDFSK